MEIVGVVAAVPGLIELAKTTTSLLNDLAKSRSALSKITEGLEVQIQALKEALELLNARGDSNSLSLPQRHKLTELVHQIGRQLQSLNDVLSAASSDSSIKRMKLLVGGVKKHLGEDVQKLETSIAILKLHLLECTLALGEKAAAATRVSRKSDVRRLLKPSDNDFIHAKLDGTLDWLSDHPIISKWVHGSHGESEAARPRSRLLVIHGSKGCGKSVLAASLADYLRSTGKSCAFFSIYHGIEKQRNVKSMISSILWQLLNMEDLPEDLLDRTCDAVTSRQNLPLAELLQSIGNVLKRPLYIIVDGIDECDEDWNDAEGPLGIIESWLSQTSLVRVVLVGRKSALYHASNRVESSIELSEDLTKADIALLIAHKLRGSPNLASMPAELVSLVQQTLSQKSAGMFLWVDLVFKELRHCYSPVAVQECLRDLPRDLDEEYARLFTNLMYRLHGRPEKHSTPTKAIQTLMALMVGSLDALSVDDLRHAHAASCCHDENWREHLLSEEAISDFLGDFIVHTGGSVRFCHSSLEEFLLRPPDSWVGKSKDISIFRLEYLACQELIGRACINYVSTTEFCYPLTDGSYDKLTQVPFLFYATRHGPLHLMHLCAVQPDSLPENVQRLKACIQGQNFGGLIEFCALASLDRDEFGQDILNAFMLMEFGPATALLELLALMDRQCGIEATYRHEKFGPDSSITLSWSQACRALRNLLSPSSVITDPQSKLYDDPLRPNGGGNPENSEHDLVLQSDQLQSSHQQRQLVEDSLPWMDASKTPMEPKADSCKSNKMSRHIAEHSDPLHATMQSQLQHMIPSHALRRALQVWVDPSGAYKRMTMAFVAKLPVPLHMFYAIMVVEPNDHELYVSLMKLAMERTEGQKSIFRVWALQENECQCATVEEQLEYVDEARNILVRLEDTPATRSTMYKVLVHRTVMLSRAKRETEAKAVLNDFLERLSATATETGNPHRRHSFFHSLAYKSEQWKALENSWLWMMAKHLVIEGYYENARLALEHVIPRTKAQHGPHDPRVLHYQAHLAECIFNCEPLSEVAGFLQRIIKEHSASRSASQSQEIKLFKLLLAQAYYVRRRYRTALEILELLLHELETQEDTRGASGTTSEGNEPVMICARVDMLDVLSGDESLDPEKAKQKELLGLCLEHLDRSPSKRCTLLEVPRRCYASSAKVNGSDHEVTLRLGVHLKNRPVLPCGWLYRLYKCKCWDSDSVLDGEDEKEHPEGEVKKFTLG